MDAGRELSAPAGHRDPPVGRRHAHDQHGDPRYVPGRAHPRDRQRRPHLRHGLLLQRLRRAGSRPRPRDLRPEPRIDDQGDLRQHHVPAVRLGHPRVRRGRPHGQPRLPWKYLVQQRRALGRLARQHPRGRHPERRGQSQAELELHVQLGLRSARTISAMPPAAHHRTSRTTISSATSPSTSTAAARR